MQNSQLQGALPGRRFRSAQLFAAKSIFRSFSQTKEMQIYNRPSAEHPGLKLWIGKFGCYIECFPQRLTSFLTTCRGRAGLPEDSEEACPVSADVRPKEVESATSGLDCVPEAAHPDEGIG